MTNNTDQEKQDRALTENWKDQWPYWKPDIESFIEMILAANTRLIRQEEKERIIEIVDNIPFYNYLHCISCDMCFIEHGEYGDAPDCHYAAEGGVLEAIEEAKKKILSNNNQSTNE